MVLAPTCTSTYSKTWWTTQFRCTLPPPPSPPSPPKECIAGMIPGQSVIQRDSAPLTFPPIFSPPSFFTRPRPVRRRPSRSTAHNGKLPGPLLFVAYFQRGAVRSSPASVLAPQPARAGDSLPVLRQHTHRRPEFLLRVLAPAPQVSPARLGPWAGTRTHQSWPTCTGTCPYYALSVGRTSFRNCRARWTCQCGRV